MDTIFIRELRLSAWVGVNPHEKMAPQTIELSIEIGVPGEAVFRSGRLRDTVDYGAVAERIRLLLSQERFGLMERLADRVALIIIEEFNAPWAKVSVAKFGAVREARSVGASVERRR